MSVLIDSDWVISYLSNRPDAVVLFNRLIQDDIAISIVTYAEVYEGIYYGRDPQHAEVIFRQFIRGVRVIGITRTIARRFATIHGALRAQGLLIPPPDIFIAATAIHYNLPLVTRNVRHFQRIPGLTLHGTP